MKRRTLLGGLAALAAAGCTAPVAAAPSAGPTAAARPDPLLADPPADIWPAAYRAAPEATREAYHDAIAAGHPPVVPVVPAWGSRVTWPHS